MNPMEGMAQQMTWAGGNTAYNLGFIPQDKLTWKPAPTANSALDIINHTLPFIKGMVPVLGGGEFAPPHTAPVTTLKDAQDQIRGAAQEYAAALRRLTPADLERTVHLPFGSFPLAQAASMPLIDLIHHHGQIAYIQTMLGDTESHFEGM